MQWISDTNNRGVQLLTRGDLEGALHSFHAALRRVTEEQDAVLRWKIASQMNRQQMIAQRLWLSQDLSEPAQTIEHNQGKRSNNFQKDTTTEITEPSNPRLPRLHGTTPTIMAQATSHFGRDQNNSPLTLDYLISDEHLFTETHVPIQLPSLNSNCLTNEYCEGVFSIFRRALPLASAGAYINSPTEVYLHEVATLVMFNLGLVQHLIGIKTRPSTNRSEWLGRALALYKCVHKSCLVAMRMEQSWSMTFFREDCFKSVDICLVFMIVLNNIGQIYTELDCEPQLGASAFRQLSVTLDFSQRNGLPSLNSLSRDEFVGLVLNSVACNGGGTTAVAA